MSIKVKCGNCGKKLKAKDESAGKKVKCPDCGKILRIPEPVIDAVDDGFDSYDDNGFDDAYGSNPYANDPYGDDPFAGGDMASYGTEVSQPGGGKKPCPMCGEMIRKAAAKCRFCGEVFGGKAKRSRKKSSSDSSLEVIDWILAILCPGIGCILGIVYAVQGKSKGGKMIGIAIAFWIMWTIINVTISVILEGAGR